MTIIAFHYTEDSILAITDGLISRGSMRVIEENSKIVKVIPRYKIPRVSMGRLHGFGEFVGNPVFIAYAGNFTLISNVLVEVTAALSRRLVLDRDENGLPTLYRRTDEGVELRSGFYSDNYNFEYDELVQLSMSLIANIVADICKKSCLDFHRNAMATPEIELLIFGEEIVNRQRNNRAQFMAFEAIHDNQAQLVRLSVLPWRPFCFGERETARTLTHQLDCLPAFDTTSLQLAKDSALAKWGSLNSTITSNESARNAALRKAVFQVIAQGNMAIGGSCTLAESTWSQQLQITTMSHDEVLVLAGS